ncbi:NAD(P)-dependent oxidoreductase [Kibdelosporangium persicum]|uniref:Nucleoside-diphosphate-sugar epimerase n=1 Tax=Kibdelosporangium persicum TaxID=2698649 RepID=A0ABX2EW12_9PSEU|nr:NAD(P)-dependent oxidoreductase [Kibdelosporangium persicum]NRN63220.1 Nucleoside-diphosphate-sugar epimerase [Kibdelosporangium persicum]
MRAAVLGGTGWVGRHVCALFEKRGHQAIAVARHRPADLPYPYERLDLADVTPDEIADLIVRERVDVVVNATDGANAHDGFHGSDEHMTRVNLDAVHTVIDALGSVPWRPRLVHLGTIHEYGVFAEGFAVHEDVPAKPANVYTRTKYAGSVAVLDATRQGKVDGVVLRITQIFGPRPSPATFPGKLLATLRVAAAGEPVSVRIAAARRDFVDVRDVAEAVVLAAGSPVTGRVINIGSGTALAIRDLVEQFVAAAGLPPGAVREDPSPVTSLGGGWMLADIRLAEELLGWRPHFGVPDSLRAMWES